MTEKLIIQSPYDLSTIEELDLASAAEVEAALSTAKSLLNNKDKELPPYQRIEILENLVDIMEENKVELIETALREGGKPLKDTKVEVERAIQGVKLGIIAIHNLKGEHIPMGLTKSSESRTAFSTREAIGIVCSLSAFNHPLNLVIHQTIPALAAGCPVILKPALTTPLSAILFAKLLHQAGLPKQWCQVLVCDNNQAEKLATDSRVAFLSFIGSAKVGWMLRSKVSPGTRCGLEHGGAAPVIVDENVNIAEIIPSLVKGAFYHAGQVCVSVQRVFIPKSISKAFIKELAVEVSKLQVGDPADENTDVGPLILPREINRIHEWVTEAKEGGATIVTGGSQHSKTCYLPTVILNPDENSKVMTQEIFGPVVCVSEYEDIESAIKQANSLPYAFQAALYSNDLNTIISTSKKLNATAVMVNDHTAFRVDWMPFGGRDQSGLGLGGIEHSVREMTREKMTVIKYQS